MPIHRHTTANITLLIGGDVEESTESGPTRSGPLSVVFKPRLIEHQTKVGERGLRTFVLELDAVWERELRRIGALDRCRWTEDPSLVASLLGLWARVGASGEHAGTVAGDWLRSVASLGRADRIFPRSPIGSAPLPGSVVRAGARLERTYTSPLGPADLAEDLSMHPSSVTRLFRRHLGCGVKACLRSIRVKHAADRLAQTNTPIVRIAGQLGFCDQAHLSREFSRSTGLTPGQFRRLAAGSEEPRRSV